MDIFATALRGGTIGSRGLPLSTMIPSAGQTFGYDAGVDADFYVAPDGDDSQVGSLTAPFATIQTALNAAQAAGGDQTIALREGTYREQPTLTSSLNNLTIKRYGSEVPVISGANLIPGFTRCVSDDEPAIGGNFDQIWKATVPVGDYPIQAMHRTIMRQDGSALSLCGIRRPERTVPDLFYDNIDQLQSPEDFPDLSISLRAGFYDTISHSGVIDQYSDAQLEQTVAALYESGNNEAFLDVVGVSDGVLNLDNAIDVEPSGQGAYALLNVLPSIQSGQWGWKDNDDGTVTFYVWPHSLPIHDVEISVRSRGLDLSRNTNSCAITVEGITFELTRGQNAQDSALRINNAAGLSGCGAVIRQCLFRHIADGRALMQNICEQGVVLEDCTFRDSVSFGLQTSPSTVSNAYNYANRYRRLRFQDISGTGMRLFGVRDTIIEDVVAYRTSAGGHANALNIYNNSDNVVVQRFIGGFTENTQLYTGYGANQLSSRLHFLHCIFPPNTNTGRGYVDQNANAVALPVAKPGNESHFINCWVPHIAERLPIMDQGGVSLGRDVMDWTIANCVIPFINETGGTINRSNNILTNASVAGNVSEVTVNRTDLHTNPDKYQFEAELGSALNSMTGLNINGLITDLETVFPGESFRKDIAGRDWDPSAPGIGPYAGDWPIVEGPPPSPDPAQGARDTLISALNASGTGSYNDLSKAVNDGTFIAIDDSANNNAFTQAGPEKQPVIEADGIELDGGDKITQAIAGGVFTVVFAFTKGGFAISGKTMISDEAAAVLIAPTSGSSSLLAATTTIIDTSDNNETVCTTRGELFTAMDQIAGRMIIVVDSLDMSGKAGLAIGRGTSNVRGRYHEIAVLDQAALGSDLTSAVNAAKLVMAA
ncbi:hypothetical protein FGU71_07145 [Erythrobacter insulae]|uniref:Right-handed parallel beta-helix repeat-containing protein n=1 Tax=Erythrobacter insulae TaxID=2584124 RepID=A0A547PCA6_9SPHN|nr:hypothetical protein [Erythrobacter insulae]TRD11664.1 hypothetical protein FGU71_07145 [Erythrobacter insulae]